MFVGQNIAVVGYHVINKVKNERCWKNVMTDIPAIYNYNF